MNSLITVRKIFKVLYIISIVLTVLMAVAVAGAMLAAVVMLTVPSLEDMLSGIVIGIPEGEEIDAIELALTAFAGAVVTAGEFVIMLFAMRYLKRVNSVGTPFTYVGASELLRLGVIAITVPFGTSFISGFILIFANIGTNVETSADITFGIILLLLSYVFKYGAALEAERARLASINANSEYISPQSPKDGDSVNDGENE